MNGVGAVLQQEHRPIANESARKALESGRKELYHRKAGLTGGNTHLKEVVSVSRGWTIPY